MGINHLQIKEELLNRIRNSDVISTTLRGVTTTTDTFDGNNSDTTFDLTNTGVKNIRSVVVDSDTLTAFVDYTFSLSEYDGTTFTITFTTAPATGTNNIEIEYDYGTGDRIYDDFNMYTIKSEDKFPRIAFDIISEVTRDKALQGSIYQSRLLFNLKCFGRGKNETENITNNLRNYLITNKLNLQRLNYLAVRGRGRMELWDLPNTTQKIFTKTLEMEAPYEFDV